VSTKPGSPSPHCSPRSLTRPSRNTAPTIESYWLSTRLWSISYTCWKHATSHLQGI
jgi:hypothetical protein